VAIRLERAKPRAAKGDEPPQTKHHSSFVLFENFDYDQASDQNDDQKNVN
jgi:hypothetical protein